MEWITGMKKHHWVLALLVALAGCREEPAAPAAPAPAAPTQAPVAAAPAASNYAEQQLAQLATVRLEADLSAFDDQDRRLIALLEEAA